MLDEPKNKYWPKNTDHTVSYLTDFCSKLPPWITRIHLFLDNASSTNKNFYTMAWAYELGVWVGSPEQAEDIIPSRRDIATSQYRSDVFTTEELMQIVASHAQAIATLCVTGEVTSPNTASIRSLSGPSTISFL